MNDNELRFYCFVNFYLSSIQQGIQTGHCAVDLVRKYAYSVNDEVSEEDEKRAYLVNQWADHHKTFIVLNGGDADGIDNAQKIICATDLPWAKFHESEGALNGLRTCVGVVLPDFIFAAQYDAELTKELADKFGGAKIYSYAFDVGVDQTFEPKVVFFPDDKYYPLIELLKGSRLAS